MTFDMDLRRAEHADQGHVCVDAHRQHRHSVDDVAVCVDVLDDRTTDILLGEPCGSSYSGERIRACKCTGPRALGRRSGQGGARVQKEGHLHDRERQKQQQGCDEDELDRCAATLARLSASMCSHTHAYGWEIELIARSSTAVS